MVPPAHWQTPPLQDRPPVQGRLQPPQWSLSDWVSTQEPPHCVALPEQRQLPALQTSPLPQLCPHWPQFAGSALRLEQPPLQHC